MARLLIAHWVNWAYPLMLNMGLERLQTFIKRIGLYHGKAKNLLETCAVLIEQYGGQVPRSREALQTLPGVGRKAPM